MKNISIEVKWGVIFSVVGLLWMVLEKVTGLHDQYIDYHLYLTNLFAIPAIVIMVLALKDKKKNFYDGDMNYGEGMLSGIVLSLIIAILSPLTQWITSYVITPEFFPVVIKRSVELGYYANEADAASYFNYGNYARQGFLMALMMGVVTTAIVMIFIKSKKTKNE
ncbi:MULTISPECIES: DUF4199 domain-containing protein [Myroides]|uniref:DUF4199 domain-containing protein n=1 Tax=Myroides odoratus TaxID=256 RepID=UPI0024C0BFED|nr:DUF4199 domain-containing protein [Myroides sp. mNGS23_01]WHT39436.1 DUF4199 domain-containing protein [Myroides sp. mNGS23_01]